MIKVLLVDDEPAANQRMKDLLQAYPQVHILGAVGNVADAASFAQQQPPDLIFLDMEMPGSVGLHLIPLLNRQATVVFVTGHETYAVQAFALGALDYLLKPVSQERLNQTMERLLSLRASLPCEKPRTFTLKTNHCLHQSIRPQEIIWIESLQNYTRLHLLDGRKLILKKTLSDWADDLPSDQFIRLDRSLLIQTALLKSTQWESRDRTILYFQGTNEGLTIGRAAASRLRELQRHS